MLTSILPSYPYQQYASDPNIPAFFDAFNGIAQGTLIAANFNGSLSDFNALNLPNYRIQNGDLLNWIGFGLYGEPRQSLPVFSNYAEGPLDTYAFNVLEPNQYKNTTNDVFLPVSDDNYIRIIQWNNFKGDGYQFTVRWLKRRVWRFLTPFGYIYPEQTYDISVVFTGPTTVDISVPLASYPTAPILQAAIEARVVLLPFQYTFTLVIT